MYTIVLEFYSPKRIDRYRQDKINSDLQEELDYQEMLDWKARVKKSREYSVYSRV